MSPRTTRTSRIAVRRLRELGADVDENNETHVQAFFSLKSRPNGPFRVSGDQLAAYIRSLDNRSLDTQLDFWMVPIENFPEGVPLRFLNAVVHPSFPDGAPFPAVEYYFIDQMIDRSNLGANVMRCGCIVPATGDAAARRGGSIVTATGVGQVTGGGGGASAATDDTAATGDGGGASAVISIAAATGGDHRIWRTGEGVEELTIQQASQRFPNVLEAMEDGKLDEQQARDIIQHRHSNIVHQRGLSSLQV